MAKTILIIGGGIEAVAGIRAAREKGLRVVVLDKNTNAPGRAYADGFIEASVYDEDEAERETLRFIEKTSIDIDGVVAIAVDATVTVVRLASVLGLPGISQEAALLATNKLLMKQRFHERGLPIPWFSQVSNLNHLKSLMRNSSFPLVLKPVDSRGARGVIRLGDSVDLKWAYEYSLSFSRCGMVMVEEWVKGSQVSTESIIYDGQSVLCGTGDRNYDRLDELFPFVIEDGGGCPSYLSPEMDTEFDQVMFKASKAIGLQRGSIKGDLVVTQDGVTIIEMAARLSGGYFSTHTIPLVYGIDLVGSVIQIALGQRPDILDLQAVNVQQYQANRFLFLPEGVVKSIRNVEKVASYPWVKVLKLYIKEGQRVTKTVDHTQRAGMVLTVSDSRELAHRRAEQAIKEIEVVVE